MYQHTRNRIIKAGFNAEIVEALAKTVALAEDLNEAARVYTEFEIEAEKLSWPQDHDFGALVLQAVCVYAKNEIAIFMLSKALARAQWCASCATSGGEGLARMQHVKELELALSRYR